MWPPVNQENHVFYSLYHIMLFDWLNGCHMVHMFINNEAHGPYIPGVHHYRGVISGVVPLLLTNEEKETDAGGK